MQVFSFFWIVMQARAYTGFNSPRCSITLPICFYLLMKHIILSKSFSVSGTQKTRCSLCSTAVRVLTFSFPAFLAFLEISYSVIDALSKLQLCFQQRSHYMASSIPGSCARAWVCACVGVGVRACGPAHAG